MGGIPPPFAENSAKIINLIFEPFPKQSLDMCWGSPEALTLPYLDYGNLGTWSWLCFNPVITTTLKPQSCYVLYSQNCLLSFINHPYYINHSFPSNIWWQIFNQKSLKKWLKVSKPGYDRLEGDTMIDDIAEDYNTK